MNGFNQYTRLTIGISEKPSFIKAFNELNDVSRQKRVKQLQKITEAHLDSNDPQYIEFNKVLNASDKFQIQYPEFNLLPVMLGNTTHYFVIDRKSLDTPVFIIVSGIGNGYTIQWINVVPNNILA